MPCLDIALRFLRLDPIQKSGLRGGMGASASLWTDMVFNIICQARDVGNVRVPDQEPPTRTTRTMFKFTHWPWIEPAPIRQRVLLLPAWPMRVLLDENVPVDLAGLLVGHAPG